MWIDDKSDGCVYDTVDCDHNCLGCNHGSMQCTSCGLIVYYPDNKCDCGHVLEDRDF